ncbi:hypothetical protein QAD02_005367 [Eretmocerus hayati]|uniref:Uncharacterized protein n=1 Tax=Eretmocerus hayati TaxID=131215 RepID=A0ACC2NSC1_9HYME|nr:hypothetical protein QAD02_005367 [Eretmocerus hayati]
MSQIQGEPLLSKEEQEDEEMREALAAVGLYEESMERKQMKMIMQMLQESQNNAKSNESDIHEDSPKKSPPPTNKSLPTFSLESKSDSDGNQRSSSSFNKKTPSREKGKNSQSAVDDQPQKHQNHQPNQSFKAEPQDPFQFDENEFPGLGRGKSNLFEQKGRNFKKLASVMAKEAASERWSLDISTCKIVDTPPLLSNGEGKLRECRPIFQDNDIESEVFDAAVAEVTRKLEKFHYECYLRSEMASNYQSPPTQICKEEEEQKPTEKPSTSNAVGDFIRNPRERATKRKAISSIAAGSCDYYFNDENSDDEFVDDTRKRKCPQAKKGDPIKKRNQGNRKIKLIDPPYEPNTDKFEIDSESSDMEFDNSNLKSLRKNTKSPAFKEISEEKSEYPRRIEPPNPFKKNGKGPVKSKQKITSESQEMKAKCSINEEEIAETLNQINEHIGETEHQPVQQMNDDDCVEITNEVKPLSTKKLTERLNMGSSILKRAQDAEQKVKRDLEEKKAEKLKQELLEKEERVNKRLQQEKDEKERNMEKQKKFNEQGEIYNAILNTSAAKKRTQGLRSESSFRIPNNSELEVVDDEPIITHTSLANEELCPICQQSFPLQVIEEHAAECTQFSSDLVRSNSQLSPSDLNECQICGIIIENGNDYCDHVMKCKERAQDERSENGELGGSSSSDTPYQTYI